MALSRKKIKKGLLLIVMSMLLLFLLIGCDDMDEQAVKSVVNETVNSTQVESIKSMVLETGHTLGELIEAGLSSPTYELYDPAEDGNTYVTIKGGVNYAGQDVIAGLQYKQIEEDDEMSYFEFYTLVYNDVPQSLLEAGSFFEYLLASYEERSE